MHGSDQSVSQSVPVQGRAWTWTEPARILKWLSRSCRPSKRRLLSPACITRADTRKPLAAVVCLLYQALLSGPTHRRPLYYIAWQFASDAASFVIRHTDPHTPLMRSRGARHIRLTQCARTHCWTTTNWHHAVVGWETGLPTRAHRAHAQRHSHRHASERADERASERARRKQEQQQQHLSSAVLRQHTPQFGFRVACGGDARARREGAATKCYPPSSSSSLGSSSSADTMATEHDTLNLSGNPFVLKLLSSFSAGNETVRRAR